MKSNLTKRAVLSGIMVFLMIFLGVNSLFAASAVVTWDPPTINEDGSELDDLAGYKLYYGTGSGNYSTTVDVGNVATYEVNNLSVDSTYYFVVTAYDTSGNESHYSNEIHKTISGSDTEPPVISGVQASGITESSATISWTTDEAANARVQYGKTASYGMTTALDSSMLTSHSRTITGLAESTLYHYRVVSADASGNQAVSGDYTFMTPAAPDITPPVISGVQASGITESSVTVSWTTNEASDTKVEYGVTTSYGMTTALGSSMVTSHSRAISGLAASTTYHYRVISTDGSGNRAVSGDYTFTTSEGVVLTSYYCDNDNDGYVSSTAAGSCLGDGCEPSGCQVTAGNDCDDTNRRVNPGVYDAVCNGIDNDCDGAVDEHYRPFLKTCGQGVCFTTQETACVDGVLTNTCTPGDPTGDDSDCNGIDENCDGTPDNNYVASVVSCGTGVCSSVGQLECFEGVETDSCVPGMPAEEPETTCGDDLDNDCDGQVDEGCAPDIEVGKVMMHEDFTEGIPVDWSAAGAWNTDNECGRTIGEPFEGAYAIVDSSCAVTAQDELVTGAFDALSCNSVKLAFSNQYHWYTGNVQVDVSADGGMTWENVAGANSDDGYPTANWKELDISSLAGSEEAMVKFKYENDAIDGFWALDNVWITCDADRVPFLARVLETVEKTVMISNSGEGDLVIDRISIGGDDASEFRVGDSDDCTDRTLLAGDSCAVDIVFAPVTSGPKSASIIIPSNDPDTPALSLPLEGTGEGMVAPVPTIKVNGSSGTVSLAKGGSVSVTIELDPGSLDGTDADWWVLLEFGGRWFYYDGYAGNWKKGELVSKQEPIAATGPVEILNRSNVSAGTYNFYFGVDTEVNGVQDQAVYYYDSVVVEVN